MKHKQAYIKLASLRLAINYVLRNRAMTKSASEWTNPLIGAGVGMGLGYLLSPEKHKLLGTLGGGLVGGAAGYGLNKLRGGKENNKTNEVFTIEKVPEASNAKIPQESKSLVGEYTYFPDPDGGVYIPAAAFEEDDKGVLVRDQEGNAILKPEPYYMYIPKNQVDTFNKIDPSLIGKLAYYTYLDRNPSWEPERGDKLFWQTGAQNALGLTPKQQLDIYYSGFGSAPSNYGFFEKLDPNYWSYNYSFPSYSSMVGLAYPELSRLAEPRFYTENNDRATLEYLKNKGLRPEDIGNYNNEKWNAVKDDFINFINSLPLAE